jgi:hypothetical protein
MLKPHYIIYMALLDKFLQITTNFFTRVDCISNFYCHASEKELHD